MSNYDGIDFPGGSRKIRSVTRPKYNGEYIQNGDYFISSDGRYFEFTEKPSLNSNYSVNTLFNWEEVTNENDIARLQYSGVNKIADNRDPSVIAEELEALNGKTIRIGPGPIEGHSKDNSLRWPDDMLDDSSDWVLFQFGKYTKPFGEDARRLAGMKNVEKKWMRAQAGKNQVSLDEYNVSAAALKQQGPSIMLPVPQDVANEIQQTWQGKQFTRLGRASIAAAAAGNFSQMGNALQDVAGNLVGFQTAMTSLALNTIPGVGGNIEFNDISGSTRGVVINPNAELLYDSPQMREVGMVFKMVASNPTEAKSIYKICQTFRQNASPEYGGTDNADSQEWKDTKQTFSGLNNENFFGNMTNFIRVPNLCKFTFMKGAKVHPWLVQFKPCAISNVEVNYTPDGTYTTHPDGSPVAVELRISFMETKLVFAQEISRDIDSKSGSF